MTARIADIKPRDLELARRYREKKLRRTTEIYAACACAFPLKIWRNGHGHAENCPAVAVLERHDREDEEMRL